MTDKRTGIPERRRDVSRGLLDRKSRGLTDARSFCYSHALIIITDSEEKRHGGTSQEVSQEVWEKGGESAGDIEARRATRIVSETIRNQSAFRQTPSRAEESLGETSRDQEEISEASGG